MDGTGDGEEDFAGGKPLVDGYQLGATEDRECSSAPTAGTGDEQGGGDDLKDRDCKTGEESVSVVDMVDRAVRIKDGEGVKISLLRRVCSHACS